MASIKYDLFSLLSNDERVIVLSSKIDRTIVTWNQDKTLEFFHYDNEEFHLEDTLTLELRPNSLNHARMFANNWLIS